MHPMNDQTLLIGDIGGTNARFALARPDAVAFDAAMTLKCEDFSSSVAAIRHYLEAVSVPARISSGSTASHTGSSPAFPFARIGSDGSKRIAWRVAR